MTPTCPTNITVNGAVDTDDTDQAAAVSSLFPAMRFSWEIKSVDAVFASNGSVTSTLTKMTDLSKEAMLQAIIDQDMRFLAVSNFKFLLTTQPDIFM